MIGHIRGKVIQSYEDRVIISSDGGIGYEICIGQSSPEVEFIEQFGIYISFIYRENGPKLFGHRFFEDKVIFEQLLKVKGVGPSNIFSLVNRLGTGVVISAIINEDWEILAKVPGIGKKTAQVIILYGKKIFAMGKIPLGNSVPIESKKSDSIFDTEISYAKSALVKLGLELSTIEPLLLKVVKWDDPTDAGSLIKLVLKEMNNGN